jgi:phosphatidylglycerophosphatase A
MHAGTRFIVNAAGTFFFVGRIPGPGGTIGSAAVYGPALLILWAGVPAFWFTAGSAVVLVAAFALSVFVGRHAEEVFGEPDPNCVVLDEVAGVALTLLWFPFVEHHQWQGILAAFFLFRFFDVFKPLGIRRLEAVPRGYGIVLDDIGAALAAWVLIQVARFLVPM